MSITHVACVLLFIKDSKQEKCLWNSKIYQARRYTDHRRMQPAKFIVIKVSAPQYNELS